MSKAADRVRSIIHAPHGPNIPPGASRAFIQLVKAIGEAGSNHEEDRVIRKEANLLMMKMKETNINPRQMKEYLVRMIYCEMLGHEAEFGYIHAVKLAQHASILEKRIGYLAVSLLMHEDHELMLLLCNTLQRDLKSTNVVEICTALTTIARVMNSEMIPAVLPLVVEKCSHTREIVRKKAILALHRFYTRSSSSVTHLLDTIRRALCDSDPGVMAASLNIFYDMARKDVTNFKDLVPSFVSILKQIIERRLPRDFDYHKVPAPWMQIKLLKIMGILGKDDQSASESMYEVIRECLQRADAQSTAAFAVVYECLCTITKIYPSPELVELAANSIGRFLKAENNNLKYLGITSLVAVVQVNPAYAAEHQMVVIDCLDDPDETLKRKTLELLCKMTNPANVTVITERLVTYLKSSVDPYLRKDLAPRIVQLAERFAPDNMWFVETMLALFEYAGDLISADTLNNLLALISNPDSGDDAADEEVRLYAFETCMELLEKQKIPDVLTHAVCWIVGEYAYLGKEYDQATVIEMITQLTERPFADELETRGWILAALVKLVSQTQLFPDVLAKKVNELKFSRAVDTQQRCYELLALRQQPQIMRRVLPLDSSSEDLEVDPNLNFLSGFVQTALRNGATPYKSKVERNPLPEVPVVETRPAESAMRFEAYDRPEKKDVHSSLFAGIARKNEPSESVGNGGGMASGDATPTADDGGDGATGTTAPQTHANVEPPKPTLSVAKKRWGKGGDQAKSAAPTPAPAATVKAAAPTPSTVTSAAAPVVESEPEAPTPAVKLPTRVVEPSPEVQRKKDLASALFAGTGAGSARTKRVSRARKAAGAPAAAAPVVATTPAVSANVIDFGDASGTTATPPPIGNNNVFDDLLGLDMGGSTAPPPPSYQTSMTSGASSLLSDGDLLGGVFGASSAPVSSTTAPAPASSGGGDLLGLDLLGGGMNPMPMAAAPSAAPMSTAAPAMNLMDGGFDLLGGGVTGGVTGGGSSNGGMLAGLSMGGMGGMVGGDPTQVPQALQSYPHVRDAAVVSPDPTVAVTVAKVFKPESLVIVLFFENRTNNNLNGVHVTVDVPAQLQSLNGSPTAFTVSMGPRETAQQILTYSATTVTSGISIKGQFSYQDVRMAPKKGFYNVSIIAGDLLRPCSITTEQFGSFWGGAGYNASQRQQTIQSSKLTNVNDFMSSMADAVHLHQVQIIGSEAILCGQVLSNSAAKCLVHGKVGRGTLEVLVRTPTPQFSQAVIHDCVSRCSA